MSYSNQLRISDEVGIPYEEFDVSYVRSGGPGGQNVNKVSSKAVVRWSVATTESLPAAVRARFLAKFESRLTLNGEVVVTSQKFRDQIRNFEDCMEKLSAMVLAVLHPPKLRRATKPSASVKQKRLDSKQEVAKKKQSRRSPRFDD